MKNGYVLDDYDIRRLMPIECARLQGFPDKWLAGLSDDRCYKAPREAVMVPIIEHLGRLLSIEALQ